MARSPLLMLLMQVCRSEANSNHASRCAVHHNEMLLCQVRRMHCSSMHAGMPNLLPPQCLQVHPCTQAIAVAGYNWVALLPTAAIDMSSTPDITVLAVLPSFYSPQQKPPRQATPSQTTDAKVPDAPAAPDAVEPQSPSRIHASDEAWLKAQTDSRRLEATWMTSDLSSVPDVLQHQEEELQSHIPGPTLLPSGLIRSICFVGEQHPSFVGQDHCSVCRVAVRCPCLHG